MSTDLRQMNGIPDVIGAMKDCRTVWGFPQIDSAAADCGAVELDDLIFRRTSFPPDEFSPGRDGDYIWLALLTGLSVRTRSVTGSLSFGSPQRLVRSCLWLAALYHRWIEIADVPLCRHLVSAVGRSASYELEMYLFVPLCRHLLSLDPTACRNASHEVEMYFLPPCLRLILTICYCLYRFFRERDIASGRSPDRDRRILFMLRLDWRRCTISRRTFKMPWNYGLSGLTRNL